MKGIYSGIMFNPDLIIEKVNEHIESKSPWFLNNDFYPL